MSTDCRDPPPPANYESTSGVIASEVKNESSDMQRAREGGTDDPEAPPWNFLFIFSVALFVLFGVFGLVMCSDH